MNYDLLDMLLYAEEPLCALPERWGQLGYKTVLV